MNVNDDYDDEYQPYLSLKQINDIKSNLGKLPVFTKSHQRPPMPLKHFQLYIDFLYYCAMRPSEPLKIRFEDIDLENREVKIHKPKTAKMYWQKASIPAPMVEKIKTHLLNGNNYASTDEFLFKGTRVTLWKYLKAAGDLAGINEVETFDKREIVGVFPYMFRHAYVQRMEDLGAKKSLRQLKLRHKFSDSEGHYSKPRIGILKSWENKYITE